MKRIAILVSIGLLLCSTAGAFQDGGGQSTKKESNKKKVVTKKKTSGTKSDNITSPRPPASPVPTRTPAPAPATTSAQAADRARQYEAIRIAGIAERTRVEQGIAGEWSDGPSRLTIARDGGKFSAVYLSGAKNVLGELLPQDLSGNLLADNQMLLTNDSYGKLVNPRYYYDGDFDQKAWIELGVDGGSLIVRFSEAKGERSRVLKRVTGNPDSRVPAAPATAEPAIEDTVDEADSGNRFGAIAYSSSTRQLGNATNYRTREAAEARARSECKSSDCRVQVWFRDSCGALAGAGNGQVGWAWSNSEVEAQRKAREECGRKGLDCAVIASECASSKTPSVTSATASVVVSATPSSSPESIVADAFGAFRQGNSYGVNTLMSAQGIANGETYCRGVAIRCLRMNYADAGEPKSIRTRVLSISDSAADIELRTTWSAVQGERCQTYNLDKTKDGWRIRYFDGPSLCQ